MAQRTCSVEDCEKPAKARGLCGGHYHKLIRYGDPLAVRRAGQPKRLPEVCTIDGCEKPCKTRGWCAMHYQRWKVHGDPLTTLRPTYGHTRSITDQGYVRIYCPDHPLAAADGHVLEHRKVLFDSGVEVPRGRDWNVHHKNGDRTDNRIENLELKRAGDHQREHMEERGFVENQYGTWPLRDSA